MPTKVLDYYTPPDPGPSLGRQLSEMLRVVVEAFVVTIVVASLFFGSVIAVLSLLEWVKQSV